MSMSLLRLALKNIRSRRTRSWLTILGVLVGVTAVVALLSIGTGVQEAVLQQFEDIGYDIILVAPMNVAGRSWGKMTFQSMRNPEQPSSCAASICSLSTALSPVR